MATQAVDEGERQFGKDTDIEVDHGELLGAIELRRCSEQAKARIVHDILRLQPLRGEFRGNPLRRVIAQKIERQHVRPRLAFRGDLVGNFGKPLFTPGNQDQMMAVLCENARKCRTNAGRCSR